MDSPSFEPPDYTAVPNMFQPHVGEAFNSPAISQKPRFSSKSRIVRILEFRKIREGPLWVKLRRRPIVQTSPLVPKLPPQQARSRASGSRHDRTSAKRFAAVSVADAATHEKARPGARPG